MGFKLKVMALFLGLNFMCTPLGLAQTQVVPQSGLNWRESVLTINRFQPANPSHRESFKCFDETYESLPITKSLYDLGYDNNDSGPLTLTQSLQERDCFQQAGWYEVKIILLDYAGNTSEYDKMLTILPGELSLSDSTVTPVASKTSGGNSTSLNIVERAKCESKSLLADGKDECVLEINLRDRFGNVIKPDGVTGNLTLALPTDSVAKNLDASQNPYGAFLAGLYLGDHLKSVSFDLPQEDSKIEVGLRAYVPTLELDTEDTGPTQMIKQVSQPVNLTLTYDPIEENKSTISTNKAVNPLFSPWVQIVADASNSTVENFALIPLNRTITMPFILSNVMEKSLPSKLIIDWASPKIESFSFRLEGDNNNPNSRRDLVSVEENPQPYSLEVSLVEPDNAPTENAFRLRPIVTYLLKIKEEDKLVRYPVSIMQSRNLEALPPFGPLRLKTSLEGTSNTETITDNAPNVILADADKILYSDWRRKTNRNFISLVRGQPPRTETSFNINTDFQNSDIAYFRGVDLTITGEGETESPVIFDQGLKTIIVEDGNVLVSRDLVYKSETDSLGIIVINSRPGDFERGNLFVYKDVKKMVGSYFLDGALLSTISTENLAAIEMIEERETTPNQNLSAPLGRQLILEGALISRNTLGGADLQNAIGPSGQIVARALGLVYDLNYLRRYEPLFDIEGLRVADKENLYCYKPGAENCYSNPAPFIIRDDSRLSANPPLGFAEDE
jgi:hypothetical protein